MTVTRIAAALAFAVAWLGAATGARAETVVLVTRPHPSALASEATVRLRGELAADNFDVRVVEAPEGADLRATLERAAASGDVEAVVSIFVDSPGDPIELWVNDRLTGKTVIRSVPDIPGTERSAERLSIQALELLRASFLELALAADREAAARSATAPPAPVAATRMAEEALANRLPKIWALEVGGCLLGSFEGVGLSAAPLLRAERAWGDYLETRITLAGLGTRARVHGSVTTDSASVSQDFGLAEVGLKLRPGHTLRPFFSVGAGVLHVVTEGLTSFPNLAQSDGLWTAVADAGVGARFGVRGRFELALEVHAQAARNYPVIRFAGTEVARSGRPTMIGSLTLLAWL